MGSCGSRPLSTISAIVSSDEPPGAGIVRNVGLAPPVVILACKEEFQLPPGFNEEIKMGSVGDGYPTHPLIKGDFVLRQDWVSEQDVCGSMERVGVINFHRASEHFNVYGSAQPTIKGLQNMIKEVRTNHGEEVLLCVIRSDPVLYLMDDTLDGGVPYSLSPVSDDKKTPIFPLKDMIVEESRVRDEVLKYCTIMKKNEFYFYGKSGAQPRSLPVIDEDRLQTSEEVFRRLEFSTPNLRYIRVEFRNESHPYNADCSIDHLVTLFQQIVKKTGSCPRVIMIDKNGLQLCHYGQMLAMVLSTQSHWLQHLSDIPSSNSMEEESCKQSALLDEIVQPLVSSLVDGNAIQLKIHEIMRQCKHPKKGDFLSIVEAAVYNYAYTPLEQKSEYRCDEEIPTLLLVHRYCMCMLLAAYANAEFTRVYRYSFNQWIVNHNAFHESLSRLRLPRFLDSALENYNRRITDKWDLIEPTMGMELDELASGFDMLGARSQLGIANFRKIPSLPIYGMAQPPKTKYRDLLAYMRKKTPEATIHMVNLREDASFIFSGDVFCPRPRFGVHLPFTTYSSTKKIEEVEKSLVKGTAMHAQADMVRQWCLKHGLTGNPDRTYDSSKDIYTLEDDPHTIYRRIPVKGLSAPSEKTFDDFTALVISGLANDADAMFAFFCDAGKCPTTMVCSICSLIMFRMQGYPDHVKLGETSMELANFAAQAKEKETFSGMEDLLSRLPAGRRLKREVDFVLDNCFESMSTMHYHLREDIASLNGQRAGMDPEKRETMGLAWHVRALNLLESYMYLIIFNAYLDEHITGDTPPAVLFKDWMERVGPSTGLYNLLDNLYVSEEDADSPMRLRVNRWRWNSTYHSFGWFEPKEPKKTPGDQRKHWGGIGY